MCLLVYGLTHFNEAKRFLYGPKLKQKPTTARMSKKKTQLSLRMSFIVNENYITNSGIIETNFQHVMVDAAQLVCHYVFVRIRKFERRMAKSFAYNKLF